MSQHTKGSWTFNKTTWCITGGDNSVFCAVVPWDVTGCRQEDLDNGNLIAALPDLYQVLFKIAGDESIRMINNELFQEARQALAKARGQVDEKIS